MTKDTILRLRTAQELKLELELELEQGQVEAEVEVQRQGRVQGQMRKANPGGTSKASVRSLSSASPPKQF